MVKDAEIINTGKFLDALYGRIERMGTNARIRLKLIVMAGIHAAS